MPNVRPSPRLPLTLFFIGALALGGLATGHAADGDSEILKWSGGRKACFILSFDDNAPSQLKHVVPELEKRKIVGTFYLNPGSPLYARDRAQWEALAKSPSVEFANHTFTHKGVTTPEELDVELARCNEVLHALRPDRKLPRLLAFGQPGGVPWTITPEAQQKALAQHHVVERPEFFGPPIHAQSVEAVLAAVEAALAKGEMGHLDFHGVGTDWLVTPLDWFLPLLDKLEAARDQLWITDLISWHKYVTEHRSAAVKVLAASNDTIRLELTTPTDPALYDQPLTLSTKVPPTWTTCTITQGATQIEAVVQDGTVQYDAIPNRGEITLHPTGR